MVAGHRVWQVEREVIRLLFFSFLFFLDLTRNPRPLGWGLEKYFRTPWGKHNVLNCELKLARKNCAR